jgi:hypothetical protein
MFEDFLGRNRMPGLFLTDDPSVEDDLLIAIILATLAIPERNPNSKSRPIVHELVASSSQTRTQTLSDFGPCTPRVTVSSISDVRLGPVMKTR